MDTVFIHPASIAGRPEASTRFPSRLGAEAVSRSSCNHSSPSALLASSPSRRLLGYFQASNAFRALRVDPDSARRFLGQQSTPFSPIVANMVDLTKDAETGDAFRVERSTQQTGSETGILSDIEDTIITVPLGADWLNRMLRKSSGPLTSSVAESWRTKARQAFAEGKFAVPTRRTEGWRLTDLRDLVETEFEPATAAEISSEDFHSIVNFPEADESRIVFVNGFFSEKLSSLKDLPAGVYVGNVSQMQNLPTDLELLANADTWTVANLMEIRQSKFSKENRIPMIRSLSPFIALNQASFEDLAVLYVPEGVAVEKPIHIVYISDESSASHVSFPRCVIVAGESATFTVVEQYLSSPSAATAAVPHFVDAVTEVHLGKSSNVKHIVLQSLALTGRIMLATCAAQAEDSEYSLATASIGSKVCRHEVDLVHDGDRTRATLNGAVIVRDRMVSDIQTRMHLKKYGTTAQHRHSTIATDYGRAVFSGCVQVEMDAQKTDAAQLSKALLVSDKARVELVPVLEIRADDVKCSHGATCSSMDEEELFYCRSRGLDANSARELILQSFAANVLDSVPYPTLKDGIRQGVTACLPPKQ